MRTIAESFALFVALLLQLVLAPRIAIMGVSPDIVLAAVVSIAAFSDLLRCVAYGACTGVMLDMLFLRPGYFTLQYALSGALSGIMPRKRASKHIQPLLICLPAYFLKEIITLVVLSTQGAAFEWARVLAKAGVGAVYTSAIAFVIYILASLIYRAAGARQGDNVIFSQKP